MHYIALVLVILAGASLAQPIEDLIEGDMILSTKQKQMLYSKLDSRNVVTNPSLRWPNAVIYYQFSPSISSSQRSLIINSLRDIERSTCVRFRPGTNGNRYISITNNAAGCFSYVGYLRSPQQLNLGNGCMYKGTIIHEFLHALGFYHQQSSADRDNFVNIHWENVQPGQEHNFNKYSSSQVTNFGIRYDYGSIMHHGPYSFSKNRKPTITATQSGGEAMGQRNGLSQSDILKINKMYNC